MSNSGNSDKWYYSNQYRNPLNVGDSVKWGSLHNPCSDGQCTGKVTKADKTLVTVNPDTSVEWDTSCKEHVTTDMVETYHSSRLVLNTDTSDTPEIQVEADVTSEVLNEGDTVIWVSKVSPCSGAQCAGRVLVIATSSKSSNSDESDIQVDWFEMCENHGERYSDNRVKWTYAFNLRKAHIQVSSDTSPNGAERFKTGDWVFWGGKYNACQNGNCRGFVSKRVGRTVRVEWHDKCEKHDDRERYTFHRDAHLTPVGRGIPKTVSPVNSVPVGQETLSVLDRKNRTIHKTRLHVGETAEFTAFGTKMEVVAESVIVRDPDWTAIMTRITGYGEVNYSVHEAHVSDDPINPGVHTRKCVNFSDMRGAIQYFTEVAFAE